ncbi:hypothetical protein CSIM01_07761 [Colletotrichum simmondsii]|uniref:Uncharacterized protein n=1 Tax=Colletotrichum simmondsii TaxID=703756 RepID=A0A135SV56_9PEZI|nr:hypothetical protein CSIM01_07761 [Colletotrichum simmondsii]
MADHACLRDPALARIKVLERISAHFVQSCMVIIHWLCRQKGRRSATSPMSLPMPREFTKLSGEILDARHPSEKNDRTISNMTARTPQMQLQTTMTLSSFEPSSTLELCTFGRSYSRLNQTTMFASPDDRDNPGSLRTSGPPKSPRCGGSNGVLVFGRQAEIRKDSASGVLARRDQAKMLVGLLAEWALLHPHRAHALLASSYELQTLKDLLGF